MPNAPTFGTGYVDWGNYVNANQGGIQADRQKVADYMSKLGGQAQSQLPTQPDLTGPDQQAGQLAGHAKTYAPAGTDPFGVAQENIATNQQALATPGGFENVLAQANANYDPIAGAAAGKGPPQAAYDPFNAALEGQNAQGLGGTPAANLKPTAPGGGGGPGKYIPGAAPLPGPSDQPSGTPEGPGGGKPRRGNAVPDDSGNGTTSPTANNPWAGYLNPGPNPFNPHKRGTP